TSAAKSVVAGSEHDRVREELRRAQEAISALTQKLEEAREIIREGVRYSDAVAWSEGMPPTGKSTRLSLSEINEYGAFSYEWDTKRARAFLEQTDVSRASSAQDDKEGTTT